MMLVYTPGRVGTCALNDTLKRHIDDEIVSLHSFTPSESLDGLPDDNVAVEKGKVLKILEEISCNSAVRAVTAVRDPIERAISSFSFFRHHYPKTSYGEKDCFLSQFNHNWYLDWFDSEVKAFFGVDVYKERLGPHEWNYYRSPSMELIVVKFPHLNAIREAAECMWDIKLGPVFKNNMIQCKPERVSGYMELKNGKFHKEFVDIMYDNKFTQHFWTPDEIEKLKEKWTE